MTRPGARVLVTGAALLAITGAVSTATGHGLEGLHRGGSNGAAGAGQGLPPATAKVTRQTLVDTQVENGRLSHGNAITVAGRLAGTVTKLPASGSTLRRGQSLYRIDDAPVVLLYGALPTYRSLSVGTKGADVKQFERNLATLGYQGFTVDDRYSSATAAAVKDWQESLGQPRTGTVELGWIVYAPAAIRVDSLKAAVGDAIGPGQPVLSYTGSRQVASADLDLSDQRLGRAGTAVKVTLPDGKVVVGTVARSRTAVRAGTGGSSQPTTKLEVTVKIPNQKALAAFDQAAVSVAFTASRRPNVLTVPLVALLALAEGGYGVEVVESGATRIISVDTGLFANGRVEVSGSALREGMTVGVPT